MEPFFNRTGGKQSIEAQKQLFLKSKEKPIVIKLPETVKPISKISKEQIDAIIMHLGIKVI